MFEAIRERLEQLATLPARLDDVAIAVAEEMRGKVKRRKRAAAKRRKEHRLSLRASGYSAREARVAVGKARRGSGISIDARAADGAVVLTASSQVQALRRKQGETVDLMEVFRRHVVTIAGFPSRRGG